VFRISFTSILYFSYPIKPALLLANSSNWRVVPQYVTFVTGTHSNRYYAYNKCLGSVTFWCRSGSSDPYLCLMNPDPTLDPTPFFSDFKDAKKKYFFHIFFLITYSQAHYLQSWKFNLLLKFCVKILFCKQSIIPLNIFMRKGKDPDPDPYLWLMEPDPGGPKTCRCGSGSGSPTLHKTTFTSLLLSI
jgi:hypothetical protein